MGSIQRRHGKLYIRWYDAKGKQQQQATGCKNEREAKSLLLDKEQQVQMVRDGRLPQAPGPTSEDRRRRTITLGELVSRFLGEVEGESSYAPPRIKSIESYRRDATVNLRSRAMPRLGESTPAATITRRDVERLREALAAPEPKGGGLAPASVVQALAALSKLFTWGRREELIDVSNPVQGVERPRAAASLDYLSWDEVSGLLAKLLELAASSPSMTYEARLRFPMASTAIYCGLRKGELFGLRWHDVDLDAGRIDVMRSYTLVPKSGHKRHVGIPPELVPILKRWQKECPTTPGALVFPVEAESAGWRSRKVGDLELRMGNRFDNLGLTEALTVSGGHLPADGKPWHMLRHTYASHFMMRGGSLFTLQRLLGHAQATTTQRYAHLAPDYLAAEVARLSFAPAPPADDLAEARRRRAAGEGDKTGNKTGTEQQGAG